MTPARMLAELEALAARLGVAIRTEPFEKGVLGGRGGLCRVRGKPTVVMDAALTATEKVAVLSAALGRFDLDAVFVHPLVRARIDASLAGRSAVPSAPRKIPLPGLARTKPR